MALRKLLTKRLFDGSKTTPSSAATFERAIAPPPPPASLLASPESSAGDRGFFRRFLLRRAVYHSSPTRLPEFLSLPVGEKLREKLRGINNATVAGDRLRFTQAPEPPIAGDSVVGNGVSVEEARKILRAAMVEKVKAKLRDVPATSISYSEFLRICVEACENRDQGEEFAKMLDDAGNVIVLGSVVFLRPEQVLQNFCMTFSFLPFLF